MHEKTAAERLTKSEQTRRTRALIIETGMACIAKYGYVGTSMNLISKEANLSRGPLHYHFEDKYDLMGAIAEALPSQASEGTVRRLEAATTLAERMNALIDVAIEQHLDDHHLIAIDLLAASRRDPELAAAILPHFTESEKRVDAWWFEYGWELGWGEEKMRAFRTVLTASLRGLALDHTSETDGANHARAAEVLRDMLLAYTIHNGGKVG